VTPDGKSRTIFATGLRNTIGFDWNPTTGELWGLDNGIDFLGDDAQPEELNKIEFGKQYGWPHVFGDGGINPQSTPAGGITKQQWKARSTPMILGYTAHAAPMQFLFYTGHAFPKDYQGDAFGTMRGSWNRATASGYEIVRIHFVNGQAQAFQPFVTGFLTDNGTTHIARPMGLAMAKDGSLLMGDDANGLIDRVSSTGASSTEGPMKAPATAMLSQTSKGAGVPLAGTRPETQPSAKSAAPVTVSSTDFTAGAPMPIKLTSYAESASPQLSWPAVTGAQSYAIILEDPDAKPVTPVVHWVIWNIPGTLNSLPEGLPGHARLTEPDGVLQGRNTHGSVGYFGPKPPIGDQPHHYHIQLFALDTVLDVPGGSDRDTLLKSVKGHVMAKGEIVGLYQQTSNPP